MDVAEELLVAAGLYSASTVTSLAVVRPSRRAAGRIEQATAGIESSLRKGRSDWDAVLGAERTGYRFRYVDRKWVESLAKQWKIRVYAAGDVDTEKEVGGEVSAGANHGLPSTKGALKRKQKFHTTYKLETDLHIIFGAVQDYICSHEQIEVFDLSGGADIVALSPLKEVISQLAVQHGYKVPHDVIVMIEEDFRRQQVEQDALAYTDWRHYIAIRAEYKICDGPRKGSVCLRAPWGASTVSVQVPCDDKWTPEGGCAEMRPDDSRTVVATCIGKVGRPSSARNELVIDAMAIYSLLIQVVAYVFGAEAGARQTGRSGC